MSDIFKLFFFFNRYQETTGSECNSDCADTRAAGSEYSAMDINYNINLER